MISFKLSQYTSHPKPFTFIYFLFKISSPGKTDFSSQCGACSGTLCEYLPRLQEEKRIASNTYSRILYFIMFLQLGKILHVREWMFNNKRMHFINIPHYLFTFISYKFVERMVLCRIRMKRLRAQQSKLLQLDTVIKQLSKKLSPSDNSKKTTLGLSEVQRTI